MKSLWWALFLLSEGSIILVHSEGQYFDRLTEGQQYFTKGSPQSRRSSSSSQPSYNAPSHSYYQKPSYGHNNGGISFKTFSIPVPDLNLPSPVEFKSGVLRSKGRIASGLLHAKAGILRVGANLLAQKAALKQQHSSGYGSHHGSGGVTSSSYGAPRPSYGGGQSGGLPAYSGISSNNAQGTGGTLNVYGGNAISSNNNNNNGFSAPAQDSYGSPLGNPIGLTSNNNFLGNGNSAIPLSSSINVGGGNSYGSPLGSPIGSQGTFNGNNVPAPIAVSSNSNQQGNVFLNNISPGDNTFLLSDSSQSLGVDPGLVGDGLVLQESRNPNGVQENGLVESNGALRSANLQEVCRSQSSLSSLLTDIFLGHEIIPDILDEPPQFPLDLSYKTIRTFPGMHVTADMTRFKPVLHWPYEPEALYTLVLSNLDINSRRNRTLSEFWHWFVANIPGDSVDNGEVIFELLFPLVLPEGDGDHRFGFFVFKQPGRMDYSSEGGKADNCSPTMSNGRGPFKSTKSFQIKYDLELTASTFFILDYNKASMEIACEWQKCIGDTINLVSPLKCGSNL